ncbi:hypothetical protein NQ318_020862 [Aromia moschata]|uniref:Uncharacterized protein n=1 Tax=Aromia moschata TaxID=1265417 RepID=A0AAV8XIJ6_9CUCU|nr:hypothetical protein NQ318_020862 [Aromia moschata]
MIKKKTVTIVHAKMIFLKCYFTALMYLNLIPFFYIHMYKIKMYKMIIIYKKIQKLSNQSMYHNFNSERFSRYFENYLNWTISSKLLQ